MSVCDSLAAYLDREQLPPGNSSSVEQIRRVIGFRGETFESRRELLRSRRVRAGGDDDRSNDRGAMRNLRRII